MTLLGLKREDTYSTGESHPQKIKDMDALLEEQYKYDILIRHNEKVLYKLLLCTSHLVIWMQFRITQITIQRFF